MYNIIVIEIKSTHQDCSYFGLSDDEMLLTATLERLIMWILSVCELSINL